MDGEGSDQKQDERVLFALLPLALRRVEVSPWRLGEIERPDSLTAPAGRTDPGNVPRPVSLSAYRRMAGSAVRLELDRGVAFLLVPVLLCVGAVAYFAADAEPGWTPILSSASVLAGSSWLARSFAPVRYTLLALLLVVAGIAAGKVETWRAGTKVIGGEITTRITARVETIEKRANGRVRLTLAILDTKRPKLRYRPDRARLTARAVPRGLEPGMAVTGLARLAPPLGPLRPDSYDFAFESYFDGIGAHGFFLKDPELVDAKPQLSVGQRLTAWIEGRRIMLAERIRGHIGGPEGEIAAALVAGVRAGIPEDVNETLRITGLAHVLSISGLHMALVAGVVIGSLRFGFAAFPGFASRQPVRKYAAVGALGALAAYLLISGSQVAAERSFLMIAVMLVALLFDRAALTMRNLAIAALLIILVSPHEVVGPSFQMSFAATAALVSAYAWWAERRAGRPRTNPATRSRLARVIRTVAIYAAGLAATSLIAGAATGIFGAWHFQRVSALGLVANLAAMPVFSVIVMPAAVAGMVLMPFGLDGWAFGMMGQGLSAALSIARWLAERTPVDAIGAIPLLSVVLLSVALVPLTLATTRAMRLLAIPFLLAGLLTIGLRDPPDALVSEDGRLVGVRAEGGLLAVNRNRPNAFTTEDWSRALSAPQLARPAKETDATAASAKIPSDRFVCVDGLCWIRTGSDGIVAHAETMPAAERACGIADVIVIADAAAANPCPHSATKVVTARRLALNGSAQFRFDRSGKAIVRHAIAEGKLRPWHDHRRFSRAARGLAPYEPKIRKTDSKPAS
jgi:ComEC/Rec2-related protein